MSPSWPELSLKNVQTTDDAVGAASANMSDAEENEEDSKCGEYAPYITTFVSDILKWLFCELFDEL